jgi:hypothetical protein
MLPNVKQKTIKPIITTVVVKGTMIYTDEYSIYARLPVWGYQHNVTAAANMRATRTAMVSTRSTSIRWKDFGRCFAPGYGLIAVSRKTRRAAKQKAPHLYPVHLRTRRSPGDMTRKLSVTLSQSVLHLPGTSRRRKPSTASQKPL